MKEKKYFSVFLIFYYDQIIFTLSAMLFKQIGLEKISGK